MHKVIPIRQLLLNHYDLKYTDSGELKEFKFFVGERIKSVWILQDQHYMCTLLHPSLKHFEIAPNEKSKAIGLVRQEFLKRSSSSSSSNIAATDPKGVATNPLIMINKSKPALTQRSELDSYMSLDVDLRENDDVLLFWKENTELFPILSSMVEAIDHVTDNSIESDEPLFEK
ncbi:unnamed protein product [Rotaria socialis]|uniref:HAT C-terminal dimerisation domain-containing protein n=1 Tax=Rotaria socialis TaxID=392032 RepID=A0A821IXR8_9BILA|nr:unnamed protein product [Rotaria socialis]CAF4705619.1 unnamed protein product [Rotaria socialis]